MPGQGPLDGVVPHPPERAALYRSRGYWQDRTLAEVFAEVFDRHRERVALLTGDRALTYGELGRWVTGLAARLHRMGLRRRDRVVVHLPNRPEFVALYFALQWIGAIPILALLPHRRLEIDYFVRLAEAVAYFGTDLELGREVRRANPCLRWLVPPGELGPDPDGDRPPAVDVDPDDPCVLLLSGGTTGIPKLIPRTHNDYLYNSPA